MNRSIRQAVRFIRKIHPMLVGSARIEAERVLKALSPPRPSAFKKEIRAAHRVKVAAKSEKHWLSTKEIRAAVMERADNKCEVCRNSFTPYFPGQLDHWLSGSGRRQPRQSVATTWALCRYCHQDRTLNIPSVGWWNDRFDLHCAIYGYRFEPHIVHAPLPRRAS
jgi:hypothetical protein